MIMIILDIETTGLTNDAGICEIGAIDFNNSNNYFLQDCRIDSEDVVTEGALKVNGRTPEQLYDINKQSQKQLIENYLSWVENQPEKLFFGQNVSWDITMIQAKSLKYGIELKFLDNHGQRGFDIHTLAQEKYNELNGHYFLNLNGRSAMNLGKVLEFCGLKDERINIDFRGVQRQGKDHSALEDCKLEGEALSRIKFGKNHFPEYVSFEIPDYLKKEK